MVDWSPIAADPIYIKAAFLTKKVGKHVAGVITKLVAERGANLSRIHVIGHSLGAHTAGFTGYFTNGKLSRVTGLDPGKQAPHFVLQNDKFLKIVFIK